MNVDKENILVNIFGERLVSLRWMRGASRYNNGGTIHKKIPALRLIIGWYKNKTNPNIATWKSEER